MRWKYLIQFTLILSLFITVISSDVIAQSVSYEEGVRVVHNDKREKWENAKEIQLELVNILGRLEAEDENYIFYKPMDIATDKDGNVYVLDAGNYRVQKYNREGEYLLSVGRPGQGPGELSRPVCLDVDADSNIYVLDVGNRRLQIYNSDGIRRLDIKIENIPAKFLLFKSNEILMVNQGIVIDVDESNKKPLPLFRVTDKDGIVLERFGEPENFEDVLLNNRGNKIYMAVDENDNVYATFRSRNRIDKYGPGRKLLMKIVRPLDYSLDFKKGKIGKEYGVPSITQMPEFPIVSTGIDIDDQGRIWVLTQKRQLSVEEKTSSEVDIVRTPGGGAVEKRNEQGNTAPPKIDIFQIEVFDAEGILLKRFPLSHLADAIKVHKNKVYVLDKYRTMQLYIYNFLILD